MILQKTEIPGCFEIVSKKMDDDRGYFIKSFQESVFKANGLCYDFNEMYYTYSKPGVVRGLHFQTPTADHAKVVICLKGEILDVVLDIRKGSPTFGKFATFKLSGNEAKFIYIPKGCAHGFCTTSSDALLLYKVETEYSAAHDKGILWNSIEFNWPVQNPVVSARDQGFPQLKDFDSPFIYNEK